MATDKAQRFLDENFGKVTRLFAADERGKEDRRSDFTPYSNRDSLWWFVGAVWALEATDQITREERQQWHREVTRLAGSE